MDRSSKVGLESGVIATEGVHGEAQVVYQVRCHCLGRGCMKGGVGPAIVAFLHVHMFTECRTSSAQV